MIIPNFGHVGEPHVDAVESARHAIQIDPIVASVLIIVAGTLVPYLLFRATKSHSLAMIVGLAEMLVVGMLTYSALPVLSAVLLITGFTLALILAFSSM
jgi:hypothetical protein